MLSADGFGVLEEPTASAARKEDEKCSAGRYPSGQER